MSITYDIDEQTGCWNCTSHKLHIGTDGFIGYFVCNLNGYRTVHRYMYAQKYGNITLDDIIRHICDNPRCINPEHLLKGTHADNVQDRVDRNRSAIGERNGRSKLTEEQVLDIYYSKDSNNYLTNKYSIDRKLIYAIKHKLIWKHILP